MEYKIVGKMNFLERKEFIDDVSKNNNNKYFKPEQDSFKGMVVKPFFVVSISSLFVAWIPFYLATSLSHAFYIHHRYNIFHFDRAEVSLLVLIITIILQIVGIKYLKKYINLYIEKTDEQIKQFFSKMKEEENDEQNFYEKYEDEIKNSKKLKSINYIAIVRAIWILFLLDFFIFAVAG